jgi:haloalkane dehalogenase
MVDHERFRNHQRTTVLSGLGPLDLSMAYTDTGAGEPVVLLHGIPTWSYLFHDVVPLLEPRCRVLAPDFLGHGYSDRRDRFDRSLVAQTAAVLALLDELGIERATFVGHDTGGGVALILGIEHPDRVARLVLANAVAYDSWPIDDMIALSDPRWRAKPPSEVADFIASGYRTESTMRTALPRHSVPASWRRIPIRRGR